MEERTLKIGPLNKHLTMLWMLCKAQKVKMFLIDWSDFMILVQIWSKFSSGFALKMGPDLGPFLINLGPI